MCTAAHKCMPTYTTWPDHSMCPSWCSDAPEHPQCYYIRSIIPKIHKIIIKTTTHLQTQSTSPGSITTLILHPLLDPVPLPISDNQYPALDCTHLVSSHLTSLNSPMFDHANSIQATSIINARSALIADAIGLRITIPLTLPELINPLHSLPS